MNYAFRLQPEGGPLTLEQPLHLGPILQDAPLQILFEFIIQPDALNKDSVLLLDGLLKASITAWPTPVSPIRLRLARDVRSEPGSNPPPTKVLSALSRLTLYRLQERARLETEAGNYDVAARHLHNLATHLLSQGEQQLAKTALLEADHIERMHAMSAAGNKVIKYQTRALLLAGIKEKAT